jgi:serine-type D-Ala-D-Ala carboxypeptidase (penicillin-binding protein 5/6)
VGRAAPSGRMGKWGMWWLILGIAGLLALLAAGPAAAQEEWDVTARAFVIMDAETGRTLLALNPQLLLPPASTIKVMTAKYVLDHLKMDDQVKVSAYAAAAPPSKINIKAGENYSVKELLYALLLSSANDGARALAEKAAGSEESFTQKLTQQVRQWGAYRTTVATANGLPKDNQYSTAEDLAIIFRRAMQDPEFARIIGTKTYEIQGERELRNHDRFLFTIPYAKGGKTGYTRASQHTYVGMFQNQDKAIIISLMGSKKKWADLRTLIEKGFALNGKPIAKLEPKEEKLRFAKKHMGNSVPVKEVKSKPKKKKRANKRKAEVSRGKKNPQVSVSSLAGAPGKKKSAKK